MQFNLIFRRCLLLFFILTVNLSYAQIKVRKATKPKAGFNHTIESLEMVKDRKGKEIIRIHLSLVVTDKSDKHINMNYNLNLYKNGRLLKTFEKDLRKGSAYTCAVTCKGSCPSILGAGKCLDCACNYDNFLSIDPGKLRKGDLFEAKIIAARRGLKDEQPGDNFKRLVYAGQK